MSDTLSLQVSVDDFADSARLKTVVEEKLGRPLAEGERVVVLKKAIDARHRKVRFQITVRTDGVDVLEGLSPTPLQEVKGAPVLIIGSGPTGLFCAYALAQKGVASIVFERGKKVQPRRKDLKGLNQRGIVDEDSNYCFGEGGAGTYSDGKLYTRSKKRGDVQGVLETLVDNGAPPDILIDARPHIGSNLLPKVVTQMRERLEAVGVQFHFGARMQEVLTDKKRVAGIRLSDGREFKGQRLVLATGHSARDVWTHLDELGVTLEAKPFAIGVRIEHEQPFINQVQYGAFADHPDLPNAAYRIVENVGNRGVFSFCMCPGGFVVPAATEKGAIVVNGMSLKKRNSPFSNSGLVVELKESDLDMSDPFSGVKLQKRIEEQAFAQGDALKAPAVRADDFLKRKRSKNFNETSYQPGLVSADLDAVFEGLPFDLCGTLREALRAFDKRMRGYAGHDAVLIATESRTSAPIRIPRDAQSLQSPDLLGLYPCGEGAGYAGGIISAAIDGIRVAGAISSSLTN